MLGHSAGYNDKLYMNLLVLMDCHLGGPLTENIRKWSGYQKILRVVSRIVRLKQEIETRLYVEKKILRRLGLKKKSKVID